MTCLGRSVDPTTITGILKNVALSLSLTLILLLNDTKKLTIVSIVRIE